MDLPCIDSPGMRPLDEHRRREHCHLGAGDDCHYLFEYQPGRSGSRIGQLIASFKCRPLVAAASAARLHFKERAIAQIAAALRACAGRAFVEAATWVPVPPSVVPGEPDHDDRLARTLERAFAGYDLDLRALLRQTRSTRPDHCGAHRLSRAALLQVIRPDGVALAACPVRSCIVLFDDLLTTGKHYKCCEQRLREALPRTPVCGWFIARRSLRARDPTDAVAG
jgi:predicted amidophosphoribosyltransferase